MLVRLRRGLATDQLESILAACKELGYHARVDAGGAVLALDGPGRPEDRSRIEDLTGVAAVLDPGEARERYERTDGETRVTAGAARFGAGSLSVVGGPCAVESFERTLEIARGVALAGGTLLRGGAFKPRTSPYSFQGLGLEGLGILARVKEATGLAIVTEVLDPRDVEEVGRVTDVFQIGARSMTNQPLLREMGRVDKPVLLKRGFGATVREFCLAAEYVLAEGNEAVILCERGVRGFDSVTRNLLDVGAVAHLKRATHLPVIVDPSHAAGRADLVRPLARAGLAAGADGLIVEVHTAPEEVHSDGAQAVSLAEFRSIVQDARELARLFGRELCLGEQAEVRESIA